MKKLLNKSSETVQNFVNNEKKKSILKIETATSLGVLVKFVLTNWLVILLSLGILGYYVSNSNLKDMLLSSELEEYNTSLEKMKNTNDELNDKIKQLEIDRKEDEAENQKLRQSLGKLGAGELKDRLLEVKDRLLDIRERGE